MDSEWAVGWTLCTQASEILEAVSGLQQKARTFLFSQNCGGYNLMSASKFQFLPCVARLMQNFDWQRFAKCGRLLFKKKVFRLKSF
jgi:hypothetical protein